MSIVVDDLNIIESSSQDTSEDEYENERRSSRRKRTTKSKPPPKPPNAFILFSLENRPRIAEENKDLSNAEISRLLGVAWRKLHPDEKKKYKKKAIDMKDQRVNNTTSTEHLGPLFLALYEANIGLNSLSGLDQH